MTSSDKVRQLSLAIERALVPVVRQDYYLLEIPYYENVGDTLIWQGERDFLSRLPYRCKGSFSYSSPRVPRLKDGDLVLFQGGGNFGDLWEAPHAYRKRIMKAFPNCRYVVFPQTVHWRDARNLAEDARFFADYDCLICARDHRSYDILASSFRNEVLLVPDMAFCIRTSAWRTPRTAPGAGSLVVKRGDPEFKPSASLEAVLRTERPAVEDWWPIERGVGRFGTVASLLRRRLPSLYDAYMQKAYLPHLIRMGIRQLSCRTDVYTTRLHACILAILLGKEKVVLFDNSYGKNRSFYDTWLKDCENVRMGDA